MKSLGCNRITWNRIDSASIRIFTQLLLEKYYFSNTYLEDIWRSSRVKIHRENDGSSRWWQKISRSSNIRPSRRPLTGAVARDSMGRHFFPESRVEGSRCVPLDQRQSAVKQWRAAQRGFYCIAERAKFQRAQCVHPPPRHAVKSPSNTFSALKRHLPSILPSLPAFLQNWMRIFPSTISLFIFFFFSPLLPLFHSNVAMWQSLFERDTPILSLSLSSCSRWIKETRVKIGRKDRWTFEDPFNGRESEICKGRGGHNARDAR